MAPDSPKDDQQKQSKECPEEVKCQKCLQLGHWTYECKGKRKYVHRSSRTDVLKKRMKTSNVNAESSQGETSAKTEAKGKKKKNKSKKESSEESDSSDSSSSSSNSSSSSSSISSTDSNGESDSSDSSKSAKSANGDGGSSSSSDLPGPIFTKEYFKRFLKGALHGGRSHLRRHLRRLNRHGPDSDEEIYIPTNIVFRMVKNPNARK